MNREARAGALAIAAVVGLLAGCSDSTDSESVDGAVTTTIAAGTVDASTTTNAPAVTSDVASRDVATTDAGVTGSEPVGAPAIPEGIADAVAALETAAAVVPDGQPFDLEDDTFQGERVWEVKVASGGQEFKLIVSRDGASVLEQRQADRPDDDVGKVASARVSAIEALTIAAAEVDGSVSEMDIDRTSDGTVVWEVEMQQTDGSKVELKIDASTGEIVRRD